MRIKPKKRLGQNFLVNKNIRGKIAGLLGLTHSDTVLEIGAGRGELTRLIAQKAKKVIALEIDPCLCAILRDNLNGLSNVEIINRDVLKFDLDSRLPKPGGKLKVFGNIPYYISTPIIERFFEHRDRIDSIFITVQKEFARRMCAKPGSKDYGAFSCFVQYYSEPKMLLEISKGSFFPVPKVDSCLVRLKMRDKPAVDAQDEALLFKVIRSAFNQRRKILRNSLQGVIFEAKLEEFFRKYGIERNIRPERLSLHDFACLVNM